MKKLLQFTVLMFLSQNILKAQYCASVADSTMTFDITKVELNGITSANINNTTACASLTGTQGTASGQADRYSDFTTSTSMPRPVLQMGNFHTLSVKYNRCGGANYGGIRMAFFDWNHDGDFLDTLEKVLIDSAYSIDTLKSINFKVPFGSYSGVTRMRIVFRFTTSISTMQSCNMTSSNVGETEDYEVELINCSGFTATIGKSFSGKLGDPAYLYGNNSLNDSNVTYVWKKNGVVISGQTGKYLIDSSITYADTGKYCVTITRANGCSSTACTNINISGGTTISCANFKYFTYTKSGMTYYFTSTGTVPAPYTARYSWTFSNGHTSTAKNPIDSSSTALTYAIMRICIDSGTKNICCDSSYQTMNNCNLYCYLSKSGDTLKVYATGGTGPRTYQWKYNGTVISGATNERYVATAAGTYCVYVTDTAGCTTSCCYTITNTSSPCAQYRYFYYTNSGTTYTFTSIIPSGVNASYYWNFDNGSTSTQANPTTTFTNNTTHTVKLKYCLKDSANNVICCDSFSRQVVVFYVPCNINANFGWYALSNGGSYRFVDSTSPKSTAYTYSWYFGDGTYGSGKNPDHTYATNGTYTVTMKVCKWVTNANQYCCDTISKTITVTGANPCNRLMPNFTWSYNGTAYAITNTTNLTGFTVTSINFYVSNGSSFNYNNPNITFKNNGTYSITMVIVAYDPSTGSSCTKYITKSIQVTNSICGSLHANNAYSKTGMTASFTNTSTGTDSTSTYLYKFGNGTTSTSPNATCTYSLPGIYRTVMYVTRKFNSDTCRDSFVRVIQITTPNACKDSGFTTYYQYNCGDYISPVCGCDSMTYRNYCYAYMAGVKQYTRTDGPCANDTSYVKICGYVYNDANKNCTKDSNEVGMPNIRIDFNSTPARSVYTNASGYYTIYLRKGTYTVTQNLTASSTSFSYSQLCPSGAITVTASNPGVYCNNNFFDTTSTCPDLSVKMGKSSNITPGFPSYKWIQYKNNGATAITGVVLRYRFMSGLSVLSSTSATYSVSGNVITWNLGTVPAYSSGVKYAKFYTPTTGISLGATVIDSVWIEPISSDCKPANNYATFNDTCVSSWDPNDKSVAQPRYVEVSSSASMDYHIRFQNTGTAPAHNVIVTDIVDPNLDLNTLQIHNTSHPMNAVLDDNRSLTFEFANIMLPDSGTDFDASQGYISYSIDRKANTPVGTEIQNTAKIYFDFNEAVITNTTINTVYLKSTGAVSTSINNHANVSVFPNPVKESATLSVHSDKAMSVSYTLYDINGRAILSNSDSKSVMNYNAELSLKNLNTGIYILHVKVNGDMKSIKIVKE